jgi:hypothetical protein
MTHGALLFILFDGACVHIYKKIKLISENSKNDSKLPSTLHDTSIGLSVEMRLFPFKPIVKLN